MKTKTNRRGRKPSERVIEEHLLSAAKQARLHAYAPYSKFKVGVALRDKNGALHTGCNIENSSFGLTICAERVALGRAVSDGGRDFTHLAIVTDSKTPSPPCGACRQVLSEFCSDNLKFIMANLGGKERRCKLGELLPFSFDASYL